MYLKVRELVQQIRKITYVNLVVNRHVITNYISLYHWNLYTL